MPLWESALMFLAACASLYALVTVFLRHGRTRRHAAITAFVLPVLLAVLFDYAYALPKDICLLLHLPYRVWGLPSLIDIFMLGLLWASAYLPYYHVAIAKKYRASAGITLRFLAAPLSFVLVSELLGEGYARLPMSALQYLCDNPWILLSLFLCVTVVILFEFPVLLAHILPTRPLKDGELKDMLLDLAEKGNVKFRRILVWNTQMRMPNALVTGFVPFARYVLVTDAMLKYFQPPLVLAVFAHEYTHIRRKHFHLLVLGGVGLMCSLFLFGMFENVMNDYLIVLCAVLTTALYVLVVFGPFYRTLERQADIDGGLLLGEPMLLAASLRALGTYVSKRKRRFSFTHYGLDERSALLHKCAGDKKFHLSLSRRLKRRVIMLTGVVLLFILAGAASLYLQKDILIAEQWTTVSEVALEREDLVSSAKALENALKLRDDNALRLYLGLHFLDLRQYEKALQILKTSEPDPTGMFTPLYYHLHKRGMFENLEELRSD
ncbi:MAG: M48 family metalloprotease [Planctomycetota bacterium]|nr:M48 family metalloprotease [Planctomycetota bacterium]